MRAVTGGGPDCTPYTSCAAPITAAAASSDRLRTTTVVASRRPTTRPAATMPGGPTMACRAVSVTRTRTRASRPSACHGCPRSHDHTLRMGPGRGHVLFPLLGGKVPGRVIVSLRAHEARAAPAAACLEEPMATVLSASALSGSAPLVNRLPAPVAVMLGIVVLAGVLLPELWVLVRHIGLMAHEGAHAFLGSSLGQKVESVRLKRDGTGETALLGAAGSGAAVAFVGYLGPSGFGLLAAALIAHAVIVPVLWIGVVLLLCLLFVVRGLFGVVLVVGTCVVLYLVARYAPGLVKAVTAYLVAWALLLGGLRQVVEHGANAGDAGKLREITHLPRALWSILWTALTLLALCFGCLLLA